MAPRQSRDPEPALAPVPGSLAGALRDFLEAHRARNYSEHTLYNHDRKLRFFLHWAAERGLVRPEEITPSILQRYQRYLYHYRKANGRPFTWSSQRQYLSSVRVFFHWLSRFGYVLLDPAANLDLPRPMKRLPKAILTASEAEQVINQPDVSTLLGLRDRALLETLYSTGIRRAETANLDVFDIDLEVGLVRIREGKGRRDRVIPVGERACRWLERYLYEARPQLVVEPDDGAVFLSRFGRRLHPHKITQRVREAVDAAEIGKGGGCHLFRHTMATLMLEGGADIRYIQQMLGHARLETTQIYTHVSIKKLKEIHERTHPARAHRDDGEGGEAPDPERSRLLGELEAEAAEEAAVDEEDDEEGGEPRTDRRT